MNIRQFPPRLIESFLLKQVRAWVGTANRFPEINVIGFADRREAANVLDYIAAGFEPGPVREWLKAWVDVQDRRSALEWRAQLGLRISRSLVPELAPSRPHQPVVKET